MSKNEILTKLFRNQSLRRSIKSFARNETLGDDLFQEVFLALHSKTEEWLYQKNKSGKLSAYAFGISVNKMTQYKDKFFKQFLAHRNLELSEEIIDEIFDADHYNKAFDKALEELNRINPCLRAVVEGASRTSLRKLSKELKIDRDYLGAALKIARKQIQSKVELPDSDTQPQIKTFKKDFEIDEYTIREHYSEPIIVKR